METELAAARREADEHGKQRRWLEKKLGDMTVKLGEIQAEVNTHQAKAAQLAEEKAVLISTLEKERIRIVEFEKGALCQQRLISMSTEREDVLRRDMATVMSEVENSKMVLSMLGPGQDQ